LGKRKVTPRGKKLSEGAQKGGADSMVGIFPGCPMNNKNYWVGILREKKSAAKKSFL